MKALRTACAITAMTLGSTAMAADISDDKVKVGVLTDMSAVYSDISGEGNVVAARMAIEDFGGKVAGKPIELIYADHQNKADIAANKARQWVDDEEVDVIADLVTTSVALAVNQVADREGKEVITLISGAASTPITNEQCIATGIHWTYDTYALANGTGRAVVEQGGDTWYFLTADYAFGDSLQSQVSRVVKENGGEVLGASRHPLETSDFSSYVLQAQASGAKIIGLANAGGDTINAILAANEFGIVQGGQKLAGLLMFITDIDALGLEVAQDLYLTTGFYWDMDEKTRAWSERFFERHGAMPSMVQAGVYSSLMHYFEAIEKAGTDETFAVREQMGKMPVEDFFSRNGRIREDGRMVHDMYLAQVKSPDESTRKWDYYNIVSTIPAEEAFQPLSQSKCELVNN
ncbi:ABC transporter substrate-binding protein [Ectothiorhodospiraceae bacterium WFHF3C12]|nr:ABC transporter substrate-binding protein [Ectothiorhodospiraceae bacterium WFHF3C12]